MVSKSLRCLAMVLAFGAMGIWAFAAAPTTPLIQNGSMEDASGESPADWSQRPDAQPSLTATWSTDKPHDGKHCLMLEGTQDTDKPWCWWKQEIQFAEPGKYVLTAWVRSEDLSRTAVILIKYFDANGQAIAHGERGIPLPKDTKGEWKQVALKLGVPEQATKASVSFTMHGSGKAWLDDISLAATAPKK